MRTSWIPVALLIVACGPAQISNAVTDLGAQQFYEGAAAPAPVEMLSLQEVQLKNFLVASGFRAADVDRGISSASVHWVDDKFNCLEEGKPASCEGFTSGSEIKVRSHPDCEWMSFYRHEMFHAILDSMGTGGDPMHSRPEWVGVNSLPGFCATYLSNDGTYRQESRGY